MSADAAASVQVPVMVITSQYHWFARLVHAFASHEHVLTRDLRQRMDAGGGQAQRVLHDAVLLGLVERVGFGWAMTAFGRRWRDETKDGPLPPPELLREAALLIPLFAQLARELPGVGDRQRLDAYFALKVPTGSAKELGSARERYREVFCGVPISPHERTQIRVPSVEHREQASKRPARTGAEDLSRYLAYVTEYNALLRNYPSSFARRYHASLFPEDTA